MSTSPTSSPFDRLKTFLPPQLGKRLSAAMGVDEAIAISDHLLSLRKVMSTYLPRYLVDTISEDPRPGQTRANSSEGSVLFADVSGFTAMSEKLSALGKEGAEEMTGIVNEYFETMLAISDRYDGDLLKFGGDALLIFFEGVSGSVRALTVAQAMQAAMNDYREVKTSQGVFPLRMSIGIGSGRVYLTNLGSAKEMNYAVMGRALEGMAKAEDRAEAGQIIVDTATREATSEIATFTPEEEDLWQCVDLRLPHDFEIEERSISASEMSADDAKLDEVLRICFSDLSFIEGLRPFVPEELVKRLIPDPMQPILYGSHRPVTVMFTNFYGIDEIIDDLGAGNLSLISDILNAYFVEMSEIIARYGGTISRVDSYVIGQRILALFGALRAHEDDPERAVRAGLEMNAAVEKVNREIVKLLQNNPESDREYGDSPLRQRIGINSGFVFAGNVGSHERREYTVMGDQVNLTARLMSVSEEGEVLIGESTARKVEGVFDLVEKEPVRVKGISNPVRNYTAVGLKARERSTTTMPLIGRESELSLALNALQDVGEGHGQLIIIRGVSGIGKTRLVEELISRAQGNGMELLLGTCLSYGQTMTYHPWAEILRAYFEIGANDEHEARVGTLERGMTSLGEGDWTPIIGSILGLAIPDTELTRDLDAKLRRQRVLDLIVKFLHARARSHPVVLVIEDVHWADSASIDVVNYLARNIVDQPIALVLPHRPDEGLPAWGENPNAVELDLEDLRDDNALQFIQAMIGPVQFPPEVAELILNKAAGNPFFIGEVVRTLMDNQILVKDSNGAWQFVETEGAIELPDTIHGVVISRIDRLSEADRRILQAASVIGRVFPLETLEGISGEGVDLPSRLAGMEGKGLIEQADLEEGGHRFIHLTTREVVYESLSFGLRRDLHGQIGDFIERTYAGMLSEQVDLLAYHYYQGQSWAKALGYNLDSGERAQVEFANDIAITSFEHALEASNKLASEQDTDAQQRRAHESLGEVLTLVGRYEDALGHYQVARDIVERAPDHTLADLYRKTAEVYERQSEYETAFTWLDKGLGSATDQLSLEVARIYLMGAGIYHRQGSNDQAAIWCKKALEATAQVQSRDSQLVAAHTYYLQGGVQNRQGQLEEALESCKRSVQIYEEVDDYLGQARANNNLSIVYSDLGEWGKATEAAHKSLAINERIGNIQEQGFVANNLGSIQQYRGEWDQALELFQESNAIWVKIGAPLPEAVTLSNIAQIYIYQERLSEAEESLRKAQEIFERVESDDFLPEVDRRWAEYYLKQGDPQTALEYIQKSIKLATEIEARIELGMSERMLGKIQLVLGNFDLAQAALEQSLHILTELDSEYEIALTKMALAWLEIKIHDGASESPYLSEAVETFEKLGAEADLKEAKELLKSK